MRRAVSPNLFNVLLAEAILAYCRERLAKYKVPKRVVFVDALPLTGAGKVDKRTLQERYGGIPNL